MIISRSIQVAATELLPPFLWLSNILLWASQVVVKNPPASAGDVRDVGSISGPGRSPGRGHGNTLQYSCLENPMDRGGWWATVYGVAKSRTRLKRLSMSMCMWMFYCVYVPHLLYPFICQWTFRLLLCLGYCKQCCSEHWIHVFFWTMFFSRYMPRIRIAGLYGSSVISF